MAQQMEEEKSKSSQGLDEDSNKRKCIIFLGGSYSPIHQGHIEILVKIKNFLEKNHNYHVVSGYLVLSSDRYVAGKLNVHGMGFEHRKTLCDMAAADYDWIHSSHIAQACAYYYIQTITRKDRYKQFFNEANGNALNDEEINSLIRIECMGADKLSETPWLMQNLAVYSDPKRCCIGRQGHTEKLIGKYNELIKKNIITKDSFYFVTENGTQTDVSSTLVRECLLKWMYAPPKHTNEKKQSDPDDNCQIETVKAKLKGLVDQTVIEYMVKNIDRLFFTEDEIMECLGKKGRVVPKSTNK
eukprot:404058_1